MSFSFIVCVLLMFFTHNFLKTVTNKGKIVSNEIKDCPLWDNNDVDIFQKPYSKRVDPLESCSGFR